VVDAAVVEDEDQDVHAVAAHGLDFHGAEPEGAVTLQGYNFLALPGCGGGVVGAVCGDGVAGADAHGGVRAGVEAQAGVGDGEDAAADVHGVGAFGDVDDAAFVWG